MKYNWEIVDELIKVLIEKNEIDENSIEIAKVCLCMLWGGNKKDVKELADCKEFERYWSNLTRGGYFQHNGKTESIEKSDTPLILMIAVADGELDRKVICENEASYKLTKKGIEKAKHILSNKYR